MIESAGFDSTLFVSEFEMALLGNIESHMSRRASRPGRADGRFYFPEFKVVVEEYTRVKHDPETLKAFTEARTLAARESLEFRALRGQWMAAQEARDRARKVRQKQREGEFLAVFRLHLPEYSEKTPLQPPDEVVLREVAGLDEFIMGQDGAIPVTPESVKKISGSLVAHHEAFNRKIRRMMVVISKRVPMDKPFTMTDDECCEYLGRATTIFLAQTKWAQEWHSYRSFTFRMRQVRSMKALFGMLDGFYVNEDYSERVGTLLECMGLPRTATLDAAIARQAKLKIVCRCRNTGFGQPGSFFELVSYPMKRREGSLVWSYLLWDQARHIATEHPQREDYESTEISVRAGTPFRYSLCSRSTPISDSSQDQGSSVKTYGIGSLLIEVRGKVGLWETISNRLESIFHISRMTITDYPSCAGYRLPRGYRIFCKYDETPIGKCTL